MYLDLD